jgi:O-acetyl-ADP-ribose deacetylase (regulator of RNase III)
MITYLKGDATSPQASGPKIIAHVCNTLGGWGKGFVLAVSRRWPEPERAYRVWHHVRKVVPSIDDGVVATTGVFGLGESQLVKVKHDTFVLNMIAQEGTREGSKGPPIRYAALALCLRHADNFARLRGASIHAPRIGCGLAGGSWEQVGPLIERIVSAPVFIYDWAD